MNRSFSSQEDGASYLDLQSAMMQNDERERLLRRMLEQQMELQQLQQRQRALLDAQQQVSRVDFVTTQDLEDKLERLQAVKQRIASLQTLLDEADNSGEPTNTQTQLAKAGATVNNLPQSGDYANTSNLVNEQLEDLYSTVTNLLADIDKMNVLSDLVDQQKRELSADQLPKPANAQSSLKKPLSPLPQVNLVETNAVAKSRFNASQKNESPDASIVERHYYYVHNKGKKEAEPPSESSFDESVAMKKPVIELWSEMRRYQSQLAELQERRRELSAYLQASQESSKSKPEDTSEASDSARITEKNLQALQSTTQNSSNPNNFTALKYFRDLKSVNVDASTEKTNATWGGSTSTSGDESDGSIEQPDATTPTLDNTSKSLFATLPSYIEKAVFKLWNELDYQNGFLQLLLDDQKALSVLLENTLSMQKDHHTTVMYGISPDFLIYQLDNCSAQIMVYRKQIVMLHKELLELQSQFPDADMSYGHGRLINQRSYLMQKEPSYFEESNQFSPRQFSLNRLSTPVKPSTTEGFLKRSTDGSFSKLYQAYQRSSPGYVFKETPNSNKNTNGSSAEKETNRIKELPVLEKSPYVSVTTVSGLNRSKTDSQPKKNLKFAEEKKEVKTEISDVDSNASGFPLFEALRDTIYSEAATLISQNEARPHFLIELFHELQQLNSDYLRQHCLFVIRDVVNGYIIETPKGVDAKTKKSTDSANASFSTDPTSKSAYTDLIHAIKPLYSENTPSDSEADNQSENLPFNAPNKASVQYDYALEVSNASILTTPGSSQEREASGDNSTQNPFESDFLGSTVIHLDEALQRVREIERLKQEKMERGETVEKKPAAVAVGGDDGGSDNLAELDAQKLDGKIKQMINKVIPVIKSGNDVCSEEKIEEISTIVSSLVSRERFSAPKTNTVSSSDRQLHVVLKQCLNKYLGYHLNECGEEVVIDISEVLFNELAYMYMIEEYEELDDDVDKVDEAIIQTMVDEECSARDQDSQSATSDLNDDSTVTSSFSAEKPMDENKENGDKNTAVADNGNSSVIVDLSVSETKPLTSYGSGEDEEEGSGEEYDQYKETDDVPTSMQNDQMTASGDKKQAETVKVGDQ